MRIVKKDARTRQYLTVEDNQPVMVEYILLSDTIFINENWRPEDYQRLVEDHKRIAAMHCHVFNEAVFDHGFTACLKALGEI